MSAVAEVPAPQRPFVGLEPYEESDAPFFFGREREEGILVGNLRGFRLTVLYGASGVGKSSVLAAGVVPRLRERYVAAGHGPLDGDRARLAVTAFSDWRGDRPLHSLMDAIRASAGEAAGRDDLRRWDGEGAVPATVRDWTQHVRELLVVLDQFEEFFLYQGAGAGAEEFARAFPDLVNDASLHIHFLIAIREDAWAKLDRFKASLPNPFANYLRLGYLDHAAARRAVECAIEVYNDTRRDAEAMTIEPALVEAVLDGVRRDRAEEAPGRNGGDARIETAFLQVVMERVWDATLAEGSRTLTARTLERLGGPQQIVRSHLERAMARLAPDEQEIAADALRFLVTSSRGKIAQRASDLAIWTRRPRDAVGHVLDELCGGGRGRARILRPLPPEAGEDVPRYELFHDVLAEAVLNWRKNYERERETEALAERMEEDKLRQVEEERTRHAEQMNRLVRLSALALALLTAALAVAVVLAWREQRIARSQGVAASAVAQLDTDPELGLLLAREAWEQQESPAADEALRLALEASLVRARIPSGDMAVGSPRGPAVATVQDDEVGVWTDAGDTLGAPLRPGGAVTAVAFASGGGLLAAAGDQGAAARPIDAGAPAVTLATNESVQAIAVSADGRFVALASEDGTSVLDAASGRRVARTADVVATALAFHPHDAGVLAMADCNGDGPRLWRWRAGAPRSLPPPRGESRRPELAGAACLLAFSPGGERLAGALRSDVLAVWTTGTARLQRSIPIDPTGVMAFDWSPDARELVAAAGMRAVVVPARAGAEQRPLQGHGESVVAADFSADGRWIVTGSYDGTARVWDAETGTLRAELRGHSSLVTAASFVGATQRVLTASDDGTARIWELDGGRALPNPDRVIEADYSPEGDRIATASVDGTARVWSVDGTRRIDVQVGDIEAALTVELMGGDRVLVAGGDAEHRGRVAIADTATGRLAAELRTGTDDVVDVDMSPSGREAVVTPYSGAPSVWDLDGRERRGRLPWRRGDYTGRASYSADGRLIVTGGTRGAQVFDARTLERRGEIPAGTATVVGASFNAAGDRLVTYGSDRTARVWSWPDRRPVVDLRGHRMWLTGGVFSVDGERIATASADGTVRIWRADTGDLLGIRSLHAGIVNSVAFSPDGRTTLSASDDRTARISACDTCGSTDRLLELASQRVTRSLTDAERRDFLDR